MSSINYDLKKKNDIFIKMLLAVSKQRVILVLLLMKWEIKEGI